MKLHKLLIATAASLAFSGSLAAQETSPEETDQGIPDTVQTAIVYGDDEAPPCPDDTTCVIVVVAESERYRIPPDLRFSDSPENTSWAKRVESLALVGDFGAFSCSTAGSGGFTGCTQKLIEQAYGEKRTSSSVRFSELINAARAERLAQIDDRAADEQARVEQIEREYMERLEREKQGELVEEAAPLPQPDSTQVAEPPAEPMSASEADDG